MDDVTILSIQFDFEDLTCNKKMNIENTEKIDLTESSDKKINEEAIDEDLLKPVQKECTICSEFKSIEDTFDMIMCVHSCCKECARSYFQTKIKEQPIMDLVCPICQQPDLRKQNSDDQQFYFSCMDPALRHLLNDEHMHNLFQSKLRDSTLNKDQRFSWCACGYGYYAENSTASCPHCLAVINPNMRNNCQNLVTTVTSSAVDIETHFNEKLIDCPNCKDQFSLDRDGCIHLTCSACKHEFCSSCRSTFYRGISNCKYCKGIKKSYEDMGLHAHHSRICYHYLRELELSELMQLLLNNSIQFQKGDLNKTSKNCRIKKCDNFKESMCAGACREHYIEYLCDKVRENRLDNVNILSVSELEKTLKRNNICLPVNYSGATYRSDLIKLITNNLPI